MNYNYKHSNDSYTKIPSKNFSKNFSKNSSKNSSKKLSKTIDSKTDNIHNAHNTYNHIIHKGGNMSCKKGEIMRVGYTTKTGKNIKPNCISAQSSTGKKTSEDVKKYIQSREKIQMEARKKFSKDASTKCPPGFIMREGYKRNSYKSHSKNGNVIKVNENWTKPQCVKSQTGKSEKGEKLIIIMEKDVLGNYGYKHVKSLSIRERKMALKKAMKDIKPLSVYRRLVALSTLNKGKDMDLAKILKDDSDWIKTQHEYVMGKSSSNAINSKASKASKASKLSTASKATKASKLSTATKTLKASKVSIASKTSKASKSSKTSKASKLSKLSKKNQKGGEITEKYSTGYIPNRELINYNLIKKYSKNYEPKKSDSKKSDSKVSLSKKNKLFYYKDN